MPKFREDAGYPEPDESVRDRAETLLNALIERLIAFGPRFIEGADTGRSESPSLPSTISIRKSRTSIEHGRPDRSLAIRVVPTYCDARAWPLADYAETATKRSRGGDLISCEKEAPLARGLLL